MTRLACALATMVALGTLALACGDDDAPAAPAASGGAGGDDADGANPPGDGGAAGTRAGESGGEGEPCGPGGTCDDGLACQDSTCVEAVQVRFCHCMFLDDGQTDLFLTMNLGPASLGPIASETCTPCEPFATDTVHSFTITTTDDEVLDNGTFTFEGSGDRLILHDATGSLMGRMGCNEPVGDFCT